MVNASQLVLAARLVRLAAAVCVAGLVIGYLAVVCFANRYGAGTPMVLDNTSNDTALSFAVRAQEATGLVCGETPTLTDVVLFQREGHDEIQVLTFDEALRASSAREGWVRRYCAAP